MCVTSRSPSDFRPRTRHRLGVRITSLSASVVIGNDDDKATTLEVAVRR